MSVYANEYTVDRGRRILLGLSFAETTEFELLDAQRSYGEQPPPAIGLRWLELFNKHHERAQRKVHDSAQ